MSYLTDILNLHAEILLKRIVDEMALRNKNASGKTAAGLQIVVADDGFKLIDTTGNFYYVEYGSAPHKIQGKASSTLAAIIKRWIKAKAIPIQGNENSVAYAIANQLKRKGSKQYQSGKPAGIIKTAVSKNYTDRLIDDLTQFLKRNIEL